MRTNEKQDALETSDFNVCVVLLYFDYQLIEIDRREPRRCIFVLSWGEKTDEIVEKFFDGELLVDPKRFIAIQKELKSRIYV